MLCAWSHPLVALTHGSIRQTSRPGTWYPVHGGVGQARVHDMPGYRLGILHHGTSIREPVWIPRARQRERAHVPRAGSRAAVVP